MDKKHHIELLDRFLHGFASEEDENILRDWIKQPEAKQAFYEYYQQCWHLAPNDMDKAIQQDIFSDILKEIGETSFPEEKIYNTPRKISLFIRRYAVAACLIVAVGLGAYFLGNEKIAQNNDGVVTMSVMNGQKADIVLADGTRVFINSGTKLTYDASYNKKDRVLSLEGEAYFEVAKDKERPFIVKANGINVEALGTSFNVKAYADEKLTSVILLKGKVKVGKDDKENVLQPNERIEYNLHSNTFEKSELHPNADHLLWRSKQLTFYGESLEEICSMLTRMYNCKFEFGSEAVKKYTYNGMIKNNSLINVLDFISQTASIKYEIKPDSTIVIY